MGRRRRERSPLRLRAAPRRLVVKRVPGIPVLTSSGSEADESRCTVLLPLAVTMLLSLRCACSRASRARPRCSCCDGASSII